MLVLTYSQHKGDNKTIITAPDGTRIECEVIAIFGNKVRIGFTAPRDWTINRECVQRLVDESKV